MSNPPLQKNCSQCGTEIGPELNIEICAACLLEEILAADKIVETPDAPAVHEPRVKSFGSYELLEEIGRGGMGVVYKARQAGLGRIVALKMLLAGEFANAEGRAQLMREARIAATLYHPNIVTIHEVGEFDGRAFFAMEYIAGRNLSEWVHGGPAEIKISAQYIAKLARAVQYAHDNQVVHRDLKPANVLVNALGEPKLTDFGLTKSLADQTITIVTAGSPNFMAPEQAASNRGATGRHTDVFGLGGILYYLLTGRPPFAGQLLGETLKAVLDEEPAPPRKLRPEIPPDLETICLKCLEKKPGDRYATALEVAEEVERWAAGQPIRARPVGRAERANKWVRRQPLVAGLIAVCILMAIAGAALAILIVRLNTASLSPTPLPQLETSSDGPLFTEGGDFSVPVGSQPLAAGVADFDRDGLVDVACISHAENSVEVLFGSPDSEFSNRARYPTGRGPHALAAADVQGDGWIDLVSANRADDTVSVLLGANGGAFAAAPGSPFPAGRSPYGVVLADVDHDQKLDIVTADAEGNSLTILLGNGRGDFTRIPALLRTGNRPWGLAAADINDDGMIDLINTDVNDFTVRVWEGQGTGEFSLAQGFPVRVGVRPFDVAVADLNRDRKADLVTTDTDDGTLTILLGGGAGRLTIPAGAALANRAYNPRKIQIADLNGDGFLDLACANETGSVGVVLANGRGGFLRDAASPYPAGGPVNSIVAADLNHDGKPDLLAVRGHADQGPGALVFFFNRRANSAKPAALLND